jgi:hypothetical protein
MLFVEDLSLVKEKKSNQKDRFLSATFLRHCNGFSLDQVPVSTTQPKLFV